MLTTTSTERVKITSSKFFRINSNIVDRQTLNTTNFDNEEYAIIIV